MDRVLVSQLLGHLDYLDEAIETVSTQIDGAMAPFAEALARLDTIRGVNKRTAEVLIAELGPDMSVFPTAKHAASWAGLCPGNHESAGKHRSGWTRLATAGSAPPGSRPPSPPASALRPAPSPRAIAASGTGATRKPSWPWPTPSS
jgi:Transposase IS116/IS110/IS902 family